jgi:hypothetical protein
MFTKGSGVNFTRKEFRWLRAGKITDLRDFCTAADIRRQAAEDLASIFINISRRVEWDATGYRAHGIGVGRVTRE